ncbi:hypothetical protein ACM26V_00220 [Salipaludibacillus sp. HK11]|uniref:hypothetical protein n=1 Tax=Salipaludibacillus sp. HK11 TaxID=3394320 RepID=UPI0039FB91E4
MPEVHYKCELSIKNNPVTVNVFCKEELDYFNLKKRAKEEGIAFMKHTFGQKVSEKDIKAIGYSKGWFG